MNTYENNDMVILRTKPSTSTTTTLLRIYLSSKIQFFSAKVRRLGPPKERLALGIPDERLLPRRDLARVFFSTTTGSTIISSSSSSSSSFLFSIPISISSIALY